MNHTSQGQAGLITTAMRQKDIRPAPAEIEYKGFKFLITDRPSDQSIHAYIQVSLCKFINRIQFSTVIQKKRFS